MTAASADIVQITDLHIHDDPAARSGGRDTLATLRSVVDAVKDDGRGAELILATGDLTDSASPTAYRRLKPLLNDLPAPVYVIPGNHDLVPAMREHLVGGPVRHEAAVRIGAWTIVLLDSTVPNEVHGHFDAGRLGALDRELAAAGTDHVLVVMHHQPAPIGSPLDVCGLMNAEDLYTVLDRHDRVKGLLWGHVHHEHDSERNGVRRLGSPSTCIQFSTEPGGINFTDQPPAYRRLSLMNDGRIETEVVWVG